MTLSLGFSPCPNDTFIFDAMIHSKIDTEDLQFELEMLDVEALNKKAFNELLAFEGNVTWEGNLEDMRED